LAALLDDVARGETIVITRRGKPIARLVPVTSSEDEVAAVIARMKAARCSRGPMNLAEILAEVTRDGGSALRSGRVGNRCLVLRR
jgi:prevent-host-death family protein